MGVDSLIGLSAGNYIIRLTDTTGCFKDTLVTISQPPPVTVVAFNDTTICLNGIALIGAQPSGGNGVPYTLIWNQGLTGNGPHMLSPTSTTTYTVSAVDSKGCTSNTDQMTVIVHPPLQVSVFGNLTICPLGNTVLTASAQGGSGMGYQFLWFTPPNSILGNGSQITLTPPQPVYSVCVIASDNCGTPSDTSCIQVIWHNVPPVSFSVQPKETCIPAAMQFINTTGGSLGSQCTWYFGDGDTAISCSSAAHVYHAPGCYDVRLKIVSPEGCIRDTLYPQFVCARPLPEAAFTFEPQPTDVYNSTIFFTNESQGAHTYLWHFGDYGSLGISNSEHPSFFFPSDQAGVYPVTLIAFNVYNCSDTAISKVVIDGALSFYLPNTFTPDGDNLNEIFKPQGNFISSEGFNFTIFDRWGEKIFETNNLNSGWNGTFRGILVKNDTYVWMVRLLESTTGAEKLFKGHVTVLR